MKKMKHIFLLLITLILSLSCFACSKKIDENEILENKNAEYHATTIAQKFAISDNTKMSAISLNDEHISNLNLPTKNLLYLYGMEISLVDNAKNALCIDIKKIEDNSIHEIPNEEKTANSLTPATFKIMEEVYGRNQAIAGGNYFIVVAEYSEANKVDFSVALIKDTGFDPKETESPSTHETSTETETETPIETETETPTETGTGTETPIPDDIYTGDDILPANSAIIADNIQDGVILHAWNWSYKTIEENLDEIKAAGYTTIQVSPVQQPKDYDESYPKGWSEQWWKLYQPVSFSIAQSSWLGTATELTSLCKKAHELGLFIIADIVSNHTANVSNDSQSDKATPAKELSSYEPALYSGRATYFRSYIANNDSSIQAVVQGNIGEPDLNTANPFVQQMVIDLLHECIDCGIDGFRFDAAKHIETPDDGAYASNFWPNVLSNATSYANSKANKTLYYYGEILNTPGAGRSFSSYTKYMNITDNVTGNNCRNAIVSGNATAAVNSSYNTGQSASKLVLWAESHDTYANSEHESTYVSEEIINKTWAIVAARKDATALYFARPNEMGSIGSYAWKNSEVTAINHFHNQFIGANEYLSSSGKFAIVERYDSNRMGAVIVNCNGNATSVSCNVSNLADGVYFDSITGNQFVVSAGKLTGEMGNIGIAVLTADLADKAPEVTLSQEGGYFSTSLDLTFNFNFTTSAKITINGKSQIINKTTTITIGQNINDGETIEVTVAAINDKYRVTKTYTFVKLSGITANSIVIADVPERYVSGDLYTVFAWVWQTGKDGRWVSVTVNGSYLVVDVNSTDDNFLLVTFSKSSVHTTDDCAWNLAVRQTSDIMIVPNAIYSAPASAWK